MKTIISHSPTETEKNAQEWVASLSTKKDELDNVGEATVVALNGHLGSGKTTFTQAVARMLGIIENVTSPTFVLMKIYDIQSPVKNTTSTNFQTGVAGFTDKFKRLIHIDAYRLEEGSQLSALNFEQIVSDPGNLILIEWAENVKEGLPVDITNINFEYVGESDRKITFI